MTAIVTDVHYRMSVALIRDLSARGVRVIACEKESQQNPVGFASSGATQCVALPNVGYEDALYELCRDTLAREGEKPALLPVGAKTLAMLSENAGRFSAVCGLCIASPAQLARFNDKSAVAALAKRLHVPVPADYIRRADEPEAAFFSRVPLPCVVKPICGEQFGLCASQRYRICHTGSDLQAAYTHFSSLTGQTPVVQEYLPGAAYGCSVLAQDGQVLRHICHRRLREYPVSGGPSSCCACESHPELLSCAEALVRETGFTGPAMFEFKCSTDGAPRLLEVNPRVWGTYPLTHVSGSDFSYSWYCLAAKLPLPSPAPAKAVKMAYYPADFAAALGYLRSGKPGLFFAAFGDFLNPNVKNGLSEAADPGPGRAYFRNLFRRGGRK